MKVRVQRSERPDLKPLVDPRSIVLVVEPGNGEPGLEIESALLTGGFAGEYRRVDVNPNMAVKPADIPTADLALISVPVKRVVGVVEMCCRKACRGAIVFNGPEGDVDAAASAWERLAHVARQHRSVAILGPNSQGVLSLSNRLFAGTGSLVRSNDLRQGPVAVVTQSGFGHALVALGDAAGLGFNHIIATGNEAGLDAVDVVRWLVDREEVRAVWLITESIRRGRSLVEVGRQARRRGKPIVVWKTGHSAVGRIAAASHTGAIASDEQIFRAGVRAGQLIAVHGEDELIDATRMLILPPRPSARGVGIVTVSGGAGVALADCVTDAGLLLPTLADRTVEHLRRYLPRTRPVGNPLDVTRKIARDLDAYKAVIGAVARDRRIGQVILCHGGIEGTSAEGLAHVVVELASGTRKPVAVVWAPRAGRAEQGLAILERAGVPQFASVHRVASAAAALWAAVTTAARGPERPTDRPVELEPPSRDGIIGEREAKGYLARYGIPVVSEIYLAVRNGEVVPPPDWRLEFPVAVKVDTTGIKSRHQAGLIRLGVGSPAEALSVGKALVRRCRQRGLVVRRLIVQEMISGIEVFVGGLVDPSFGPVVAVGMGGPLVEVLSRPVLRLAPLTIDEARKAVKECEIAAQLSSRQTAAVAEAVSRLSRLLWDQADWIKQVDVNPLFVTTSGVLAADAVVVSIRSASSTGL